MILIETDDSLPLTHKAALDADGNVDSQIMVYLTALATDYAYTYYEEESEREAVKIEYERIKNAVPAWKDIPYVEERFFIIPQAVAETLGVPSNDVEVPEKTLRMHPDNAAKLDADFLAKCTVRPVERITFS